MIQNNGFEALAVRANLRSNEEAMKLIQQTKDHFGSIDVLINNAGGSFAAPSEEITPNGWNAIIETNLNTNFFCSKEVCKVMRNQKQGGKIINMSLIAGFLPDVHHAPYSVAKAGLNLLNQTLVVEWAKYNITVNGIAPGFIETEGLKLQGQTNTDSIPLKRLGKKKNVFGTALFLVSYLRNYITGETIRVDGGMRGAMRM
ncbi:SDR family oxidoreductase [Bacillaceae bacterium S4-13-56]